MELSKLLDDLFPTIVGVKGPDKVPPVAVAEKAEVKSLGGFALSVKPTPASPKLGASTLPKTTFELIIKEQLYMDSINSTILRLVPSGIVSVVEM